VAQARKRRGGLWVGAGGARAVRRWRRGVGHGRGREGEGHGAGKEILDRELGLAAAPGEELVEGLGMSGNPRICIYTFNYWVHMSVVS
jgi:hypothetical protein